MGQRRHVHVRRRGRLRSTWCGAPATGLLLHGLDHAAELAASGDVLRACPICAQAAVAAVLAGAGDPQRIPRASEDRA